MNELCIQLITILGQIRLLHYQFSEFLYGSAETCFEVVKMEQMEAVSLQIPLISRFIERSGGKCKLMTS